MAFFDDLPAQDLSFLSGGQPIEQKKSGALRALGDTGIAAARGTVTGVKLLSDVAGADNPVSRGLGTAQDYLTSLESPERAAEKAARAEKIKEAEQSGSTWAEVAANLGAFAEAPIDTIVEGAATAVPTLAAAMLPGARESMIARLALGAGVGAAQGVGAVKGSIYDAVKQRYLEEGKTPQEADQRAAAAQAYNSANAAQMAIGAGAGALAGTTGAEALVARAVGTRVAQGAQRSALGRALMGGLAEAGPEAIQGGQERLASNIALQNEGFSVPTWQGVAGQATIEGVAGAGVGAGIGAVAAPAQAQRGPLSRAAETAAGVQAGQAERMAAEIGMPPVDPSSPGGTGSPDEGTVIDRRPVTAGEVDVPGDTTNPGTGERIPAGPASAAAIAAGVDPDIALANMQAQADADRKAQRTYTREPGGQPVQMVDVTPPMERADLPPAFEPDTRSPNAIYEAIEEGQQRQQQMGETLRSIVDRQEQADEAKNAEPTRNAIVPFRPPKFDPEVIDGDGLIRVVEEARAEAPDFAGHTDLAGRAFAVNPDLTLQVLRDPNLGHAQESSVLNAILRGGRADEQYAKQLAEAVARQQARPEASRAQPETGGPSGVLPQGTAVDAAAPQQVAGEAPAASATQGGTQEAPRVGPIGESDQDRSRREWRENYDRVSSAPDLTRVDTTSLGRAANYAARVIADQKRKGWDGGPVDTALINAFEQEKAFFDAELKRRDNARTNQGQRGGSPVAESQAPALEAGDGGVAPATGSVAPDSPPLRIEYVSDKGMIVVGDTQPNKDRIKAAGGKWNSARKGWIFPRSRETAVRAALGELLGGTNAGTAAEVAAPGAGRAGDSPVGVPGDRNPVGENAVGRVDDVPEAPAPGSRADRTVRGAQPEPDAALTGEPSVQAPRASANTIFTEDAAAKAREILRRKLGGGTLTSGVDPEVMMAGITLAGYHIEKGARSFAAYAKAMVDDLGDTVRPYLRSWYLAIKYDPRAAGFADAMDDSEAAINAGLRAIEKPAQPAPSEASSPSLDTAPGRMAVAQQVADRFVGQQGFPTIVDARKFISEIVGQKIEAGTQAAKRADETIEMGVVLAGREIVSAARRQGRSDDVIFDRLVALYGLQPNLSVRSSTSVREQAYSTPVPLAFLASRLADIKPGDKVLEPTAGNGVLLVEVDPKNATVNELNPDRAENLRAMGFTATSANAATEPLGDLVDAQVMNPPFGAVKGDDGQTVYFDVAPGYSTREIDHAIVFSALKSLKDDGNAVLIVGGVDASSEEQIRDGYRAKGKREFYFRLYQQFRVVDHFTVDGDLYSRQGAGYPVDVVVIRGRGKATRDLPAADLPQRIASWAELKEKLNASYPVETGVRDSGANRSDGAARGTDGTAVDPGALRPGDGPREQGTGPAGSDGVRGTRAGYGDSGLPGAGRARVRGEQLGTTDGADVRGDGRGGEYVPGQGDGLQSDRTDRAGGNGPGDVGGTGRSGGQPIKSGLTDRRGAEQETATQAAYNPKSKAASVGTLVPINMRDAIQASLDRVQAEVGDLDRFVSDALGMQSIKDYFSAEQVDALALAIYNAEKDSGFIIGDQTGVGKGRVVAGMIRYALNKGKVPIFVTEKPNLYADMIRDLDDIGMADDLGLESKRPAILVTNDGDSVPYELLRNVGGETVESKFALRSPKTGKELSRLMGGMVESGSIAPYKVIFTTYSQLQTVKGKMTDRMNFVQHFGNGGYTIFDESHNAGGTASDQARTKDQRARQKAGETTVTGRSAFVRGLVQRSAGSFFSSATYAKRPDVMDLYSSTNMLLAVDKPAALGPAIKAGGVPMQQIVATMLTEDGQYIRRERTFAGVGYETRTMKVDRETAENMATSMRKILAISRAKDKAVKALQKEADREGAMIRVEGENTQVQGANFGAIMHNLIDQMLLALKSKDSVAYAIERLKAGEKVVLTVSNTMGSFIKEFATEMGIRNGDPVSLSFSDLYLRYLEKQRWVKIKPAGGGPTIDHRMTDEELGPQLVRAFSEVQAFIENAGFGDAPISPIDFMHAELRKAGFKTDEITGRQMVVNYRDDGGAVLGSRQATIRQRLAAIRGFNGGTIDALILNQSGSTGLSLHASEKVKDQRKRRMLIVQAEKNIDTHMQMLGRVHRTGQVVTPDYTQAMADIPAEMRPAAVLTKKMASLNANTTASRKSAVAAEGVVDFMNDYGGQAAAEFLLDNPEIHRAIGGSDRIPLPDDPSEANEDTIRKLSGYIPILEIDLQEQVYRDIVERYNELVERETSMGTNKLEARALDLGARTISREQATAVKAGADKTSRFAEPAYMELVDVKRTVKPMSSAEVREQVAASLSGKTAEQYATDLTREVREATAKYMDARRKALESADADVVRVQREVDTIRMQQGTVEAALKYPIGGPITITDKDGVVTYGAILAISNTGKTKNPVAGSSWKVAIALANGDARTITLNLNQIGRQFTIKPESGDVMTVGDDGKPAFVPIMELFDRGGTLRREKRWMVTGNILAGFSQFPGQIVNYTKDDGTTAHGVLMRRGFDYGKVKERTALAFSSAQQVADFFSQAQRNSAIGTPDRGVRIIAVGDGRFDVVTSSSKREGGTFFLDRGLTDAMGGDFFKSGPLMRGRIDGDRLVPVVEHLMSRDDVTLSALTNMDVARRVLGIGGAETAFSRGDIMFSAKKQSASMPAADVRGIVNQAARNWKNAPKIHVIGSMDEAPKPVQDNANSQADGGADGEVEGFWHRGEVWIVADAMESAADVVRVLMHETLGHHGLRGAFGKRLAGILDQIIAARPGEIRAKLKEYGLQNTEAQRWIAAEEVLAVMAQKNPQIGYVRRAVAAIRTWIRETFPGLNLRMSDDEIIANFLLPARRFVERGARTAVGGADAMQRAWHGSPHKFDKFSTDAIGTGEGAQAYGWGLYFSSLREIAESYRDRLSPHKALRIDGKRPEFDMGGPGGTPSDAGKVTNLAILRLQEAQSVERALKDESDPAVAAKIRELAPSVSFERSGALYEVEVPEDEDFLLWDKPVSESPAKVREALRGIEYDPRLDSDVRKMLRDTGVENARGSALYRLLTASYDLGGPEGASKFLRERGIAGIRYLDGVSRGAGEGSFNYALFDAERAEIAATFSRAAMPRDTGLFVNEALAEMAQHDEMFRYPVSKKTTLDGVMADVFPRAQYLGEETRQDEREESGADERHVFRTPDGKAMYVFERGKEVWLDISRLEEGERGAGFYAAVMNYAHNAGKRFIGDPAGLSEAAVVRRTSAMLSSALRFGTTKHLDAAPEQLAGIPEKGIQPLRWQGDDLEKTTALIESFLGTLYTQFPGLREYRYDFRGNRFVDRRGRPIDAARLERGQGSPAGRQSRAGQATLRRGIFLQSLVESEGRARPELLENILARGRSLVSDGGLGAMFSRRATRKITESARQSFSDLMQSERRFNWWNRSIGTQYQKAQQNADFGRVFNGVQDYIQDVSEFGTRAAGEAPTLLPRLDKIRDVFKKPVSAQDQKAIAKALYEGTLAGESVLEGKVWTDDELRGQFDMNDRQVGLYREARAAVDRSMDDLGRTEIIKLANGLADPGVLADARVADSMSAAADMLTQNLRDLARDEMDDGKKAELLSTVRSIRAQARRMEKLKAAGYMPLMRFGRYAVNVPNPENPEESLHFALFDSEREANRHARELRASPEFSALDVTQGIISERASQLMQGVDPATLELFAEAIGASESEVFQEFIRLTKNQRSAMKRLLERKGTPGYSEDVKRSLAAFITSNARAASSNLHLSQMLKSTQNIKAGDVKDEAIGLVKHILDPMRDPSAKLRSLMFMQFIGGSVASALVNMTQPFTMTIPYLSQFSGPATAARMLARAMVSAARGVTGDEADALRRAERDGIVSPQEIHFLYGEAEKAFGSNPLLQRAGFLWGAPFGLAEQFNRRATFLAAYRLAVEQKRPNPFAFAEKAVVETQGIYNRGNASNWARNPVGGALLTFRQFSVAYLELMKRLPKRERAVALAVLALAAGIEGLPFADDLDDMLDTIAQALGYNWSSKAAKRRFITDTLGAEAAQFVTRGVSAFLPIDVSARMGMANLIPATGFGLKSSQNKMQEVSDFFGAPGGVVKQAAAGVENLLRGDVAGAGAAVMPVALQNVLNPNRGALAMLATGEYRDDRGRKVVDVDGFDAMMKGLGFQPTTVADPQMRTRILQQSISLARAVESEIAGKLAEARVDRDPEKAREAREILLDWNRKNPEAPIRIEESQVNRRVKEMRATKEARVVSRAPKEMRPAALAALGG